MEMVFINGRMDLNMKDLIIKAKSKAVEFFIILLAKDILEIGIMENNKAMEKLSPNKALSKKMEYGQMVNLTSLLLRVISKIYLCLTIVAIGNKLIEIYSNFKKYFD